VAGWRLAFEAPLVDEVETAVEQGVVRGEGNAGEGEGAGGLGGVAGGVEDEEPSTVN
jgi:hypothetical protein